MSRPNRTRPNVARVAAAAAVSATPIAVVAHAPAPVVADDLIEWCTTETLPIEEVQEGATSELTCDWIDPEELGERSVLSLVATHYDGPSGSGAVLDITGSCDGSIAFGSTDTWNDRITSTRQRSCGTIKHFDSATLTGDNEVHDGAANSVLTLTTMNNRTSSVGYSST